MHTPAEERINKTRGPHKGRRRQVTFVKATPIVSTVQKIGRNEPCPCGSTKKFKRCCKTSDNIRPPEIEVIQ
jgi:uncharacterized protein YecA (UPF0149 family)